MRSFFILGLLLLAGCAHHDGDLEMTPPPRVKLTPKIDLSKYSEPFGNAPANADLEEIFLSLPDELAADMPINIRKGYIEQSAGETTVPLFDPAHKYAEYYNDNPYNPYQASSRFYLKILPSAKYGYVVAIHLLKPTIDLPPTPSNTFFLAPKDSRWIDITNEVLPSSVPRDWYIQPSRNSLVIEAGPYEKNPYGGWTEGVRTKDLLWDGDHFRVRTPASREFTH